MGNTLGWRRGLYELGFLQRDALTRRVLDRTVDGPAVSRRSISDPQQVFPLAEVALEAHALGKSYRPVSNSGSPTKKRTVLPMAAGGAKVSQI